MSDIVNNINQNSKEINEHNGLNYLELLNKLRNEAYDNEELEKIKTQSLKSKKSNSNDIHIPLKKKSFNNLVTAKNNLSPKDYYNELTKCQNTFIMMLTKYLKEQVNNDFQKNKLTNLEMISNGKKFIISTLCLNNQVLSHEEYQECIDGIREFPGKYSDEYKYLDSLIHNKRINFIDNVNSLDIMAKNNIIISLKNGKLILHSKYVKA